MTQFTKMHGLGNDFIVFEGPFEISPKKIAQLCDRHTGVGADGVMIVSSLPDQQIKMEYWNADGSDAEMCGNGLRCVVKFAVDRKLTAPSDNILVQTPAGLLKASWDGKDSTQIEVQVGKVINNNETIELEGHKMHTASVGNPHAVSFISDISAVDIAVVGPKIETNSHFPHKTNVEFVQIRDDGLDVSIWERGSGQTLACGTGMVACAMLAHDLHGNEFPVQITVPGGCATAWLDSEGYMRLKGPAEIVFTGEIDD